MKMQVLQTMRSESGLLQVGHKSEKWQWRQNLPTWRHRQFFSSSRVSLVKFSYWSKFDVHIITGFEVKTIFVCNGLTRNREIGHTPAWILPNICRLGLVRDTKYGTNFSNEKLLNAVKCQCYVQHLTFLNHKGKTVD